MYIYMYMYIHVHVLYSAYEEASVCVCDDMCVCCRLDRISSRVALHKKSQFIPKLVGYWKLKRQSRNGVPLLRRLQASNHGQRTATAVSPFTIRTQHENLSALITLDWEVLRS